MKIAFIFGKGIDGCGVTRGALFFEKWLHGAGVESIIVDFDNGQTFGRAKDANWIGKLYSVEKNDTIDSIKHIVDAVDSCDVAIFHSHPTRKQAQYADRYREFVSRIQKPIIVMHDHSIARVNINAIPQACELFSMADIAVIQSLDGYSKQAYTAFDPGLAPVLIENPIWIEPSKYSKFRKNFIDRENHLLYMGRMSPLKDPAMICRMQPHMPNWKLSIIGCENSISSVSMYDEDLSINPAPYVPAFRPMIRQFSMNKQGQYTLNEKEAAKNWKISSYDKYQYNWGMETLGSAFASWCGYKLSDPEEYGYRMEYTMIESFLLTLPIINRHFAENARSPEGKLWGEYGCALVSQAREEIQLSSELMRLRNNQKEWEERTLACQELIHKFNDIEVIGIKFLEDIIRLGKRPNKIDGLDRICQYFPDARKRRANGEIVMSSANGVLSKRPMIMVDGKQKDL